MIRTGSRILQGVGIGLFCAVAVCALYLNGLLEPAELRSLDYRFQAIPRGVSANKSGDIVVIEIGSASLASLNNAMAIRWPWPRMIYGDMLGYLKHCGARAVVFDMYFYERDIQRDGIDSDESDGRLVEGTAGHGNTFHSFLLKQDSPMPDEQDRVAAVHAKYEDLNIYLPNYCHVTNYYHGELPPVPLAGASRHLGFVNVLSEQHEDVVIHRTPLVASYHGRIVMSLPLAVAWDLSGRSSLSADGGELRFGDSRIPVDDELQAYMWWYSADPDPFTRVEAYTVIRNMAAWMSGGKTEVPAELELDPGLFKGRIVLIGSTATGLFDIKATPVTRAMPGVIVQATALQNTLSGDFVRRWPRRATGVAVFAFCALAGAACRAQRRAAFPVAFMAAASGLLVWLSYTALADRHLFVDLVPPLFGGFLTMTITLAVNVLSERSHSKQVRGMFQHYVDKSVVNELIANPDSLKLGGEERYCTAFFSDVAGFTSMCEMMTPEQVVRVMNMYLSAMSDIIVEEGGFIDKYVADEIVSVFGAPTIHPDHAARACRAALRMAVRCAEMQDELLEAGAPDRIYARMGISTGAMIVGNIGSGTRRNYTAMGDAVNLGSRVMGVNKLFGTTMLVTGEVYDSVEGQFLFREIDTVRVLGKREPVVLYELVGGNDKPVPEFHADYSEGLKLYRAGDWRRAAERFGRAAELADTAAGEMARRCGEFLRNAPAHWDGVWDLTSK